MNWKWKSVHPSNEPQQSFTPCAAWISALPTVTLTSWRCHTPKTLPQQEGHSAFALGGSLRLLALTQNKVFNNNSSSSLSSPEVKWLTGVKIALKKIAPLKCQIGFEVYIRIFDCHRKSRGSPETVHGEGVSIVSILHMRVDRLEQIFPVLI